VGFRNCRGKAAVLNDLAGMARGEILLLADARQRFDPGVVQALVAPFEDPGVGAVSGELILSEYPEERAVGAGAGFYWRYEKRIRRSESRIDSTVGATGAIYAIRRRLFEAIPPDTILDDVLIPMRISRRGFRVLFEPEARAWDQVPETPRQEFARKTRTIAGNFQLFARERWLLNPRRNRLWFQTMSHKLLRLASPFLGAAMIGSTAVRAPGSAFFSAMLVAEVTFVTTALVGRRLRGSFRSAPARASLLAVPYFFCLLNWATVVGLVRYLGGRQSAAWEKAFAGDGPPGDARSAGPSRGPSPHPASRRSA